MQTLETFNDRLDGPPACRRFEVSAKSDGSFSALMLIVIELLKNNAAAQPDCDRRLREKRLQLFTDLTRLYGDPEQQDDLRHAVDTMDLVTGTAWGRLFYARSEATDDGAHTAQGD